MSENKKDRIEFRAPKRDGKDEGNRSVGTHYASEERTGPHATDVYKPSDIEVNQDPMAKTYRPADDKPSESRR